MPLTLAHPAAVLPLRRYLPLSALVAGSLSPDFEYPLRLAGVSRFSHTPAGVLYFCVTVGLFCLWLFHRVLKRPGALLLPARVRCRLTAEMMSFSFVPADRLLLIIVALAVGAFTHVAWDSLTHEYGWAVVRCAPLRANLFSVGGHGLKAYKALQYASSLLGLAVIAVYFVRWLRRENGAVPAEVAGLTDVARRRVLACISLATTGASLVAGVRAALPERGLYAAQVFAVQAVIGAMVGFAACVLVYSLAWRITPSRV